VLIGVRAEGRKDLVALADGYRESTESWADLLRDASTVSAVWNAAFHTGTGIGAVFVGAPAATGIGCADGAGCVCRLDRWVSSARGDGVVTT
jgi:hypothetical protein